MSLTRDSILRNIHAYSKTQLEYMQDAICAAVISGEISQSWQDVSNAIDAEIDRRLGYLPPFWSLSAC